MALVATMSALVLGLMTSSAKEAFDAQDEAIKHSAVQILVLDRLLANYGPETEGVRTRLKSLVQERVEALWPAAGERPGTLDRPEVMLAGEGIQRAILDLAPRDEAQRWLRGRALEIAIDLGQTRWLVLSRVGPSLSVPFVVVVVFWHAVTFASFGLFAPRNTTVVVALLIAATSVAGAIFLILELQQPLDGWIKVSGAPLRYAVDHLGR